MLNVCDIVQLSWLRQNKCNQIDVLKRTTSVPISVLCYDLDKDLTSVWYSVFTQSCFPKNGCSYCEHVFESNTHCYFSMTYWRNWWHKLPQVGLEPGLRVSISLNLTHPLTCSSTTAGPRPGLFQEKMNVTFNWIRLLPKNYKSTSFCLHIFNEQAFPLNVNS